MLSGGPWANSIVEFDASTRAAFEAFLTAECHSLAPAEQFGILPDLEATGGSCAAPARRADRALGIDVDGQIQAMALFSLDGTAQTKHIMRLYVGVAREARRSGMGTALFMRCVAIARSAGLRYIVIEDVEADALSFAGMASAEIIFVDGECQAWIELGPATPAPNAQHLADLCEG